MELQVAGALVADLDRVARAEGVGQHDRLGQARSAKHVAAVLAKVACGHTHNTHTHTRERQHAGVEMRWEKRKVRVTATGERREGEGEEVVCM